MRLLAGIFLAIGIFCIVILGFGLYETVPRGSSLEWVVTGPPVVGFFTLSAGIALLAMSSKKYREQES